MRDKRYLFLGTIGLTLAVGVGFMTALIEPAAAGPTQLVPNTFQVDPFWPKPLPDNWVTGEVGGTCIDSQDHLFIVTRGFQTGGLTSPEGVAGLPGKSRASPPVIEFDPDGNVVNSWGSTAIVATGPNAGKNAVLPNGIHGCFIDYQDNIWIGGNSGDGVVQKYSHDGSTLLLQIGTKFLCDDGTPSGGACANVALEGQSKTLLNLPADIAVDPSNGDVYIADGYGNHRVVVFDRFGTYLRQMGGVGTGPGQFTAGDGGHPDCVVIGKNGLVYACDRGNDRINVYQKNGTFVQAIPVIPGTAALGTAGSAWDVDFSPDRQQTFMYESDGGNEIVWTFDHRAALLGSPDAILAGFGRPGHMAGDFTFLHMMAIDSKGNLYAGETIGGRRVQKFINCGADNDRDRDRGKDRSPNGCRGKSGDR
jgi:DNA-binding beta-propeller fold protein YncE